MLLLPLLLVSMDVSVLYFAVPFISRDLQPSSTQQLWIFDIYGFVLAGLLITMGSLGDRIGRRRLLLTGAAAFSLASLGAAYSHTAGELIAARAVMGIAGATLMPSTLALIRNMYHDEKQRRTAITVWTSGMMSGVALGPVLSGFLLNHFWWGSVFLINTPFMVLLLGLAPVLVPEFRGPQAGRFDLTGSVLSLGAVLPAIYGITEIAANGPDLARAASIAAGPGPAAGPDPLAPRPVPIRPYPAASTAAACMRTGSPVASRQMQLRAAWPVRLWSPHTDSPAARTGRDPGPGALRALPAARTLPGRRSRAWRTESMLGRRDLRTGRDHCRKAATWPSPTRSAGHPACASRRIGPGP